MINTKTIFRPDECSDSGNVAPAGSHDGETGRISRLRTSDPARDWNSIMNRRRPAAFLLLSCALLATIDQTAAAQNADAARVFSDNSPLEDPRLKPPRDTYDAYHPWEPPTSLPAWKQTARQIREQVLVAAGLWPLPEKTPLEPVIHGAIERDGYIVEKV